MRKGHKPVQTDLPMDIYQQLKDYAHKERRGMGPQAAVIIEEWLASHVAGPVGAGGKR